uniref:ATP-grasp domain-containing protein n=1 Tax=Emiliania huxleyi TaxID=2903 RepID=A0A7S3X7L5_EMIHU
MSQKKCSGSLILYQREDLVRSSSDVQGVVDYVKQTLDALGIRNGPSHTEVMRTDEGEVVLLEVNPRFQGCRPHARDAAALGRSAFEAVADSFLRPAIFMAEAEKPYTSEKAVCQLFLACPCEQAGALNKEMLSLIACLPTFVTFNRELYPLNRFCPRQGEREWFSRTGRVVFPPIRCKGRTTYLLNSPGVILLSDADATREADYDLIRRNERGLYLPAEPPFDCLCCKDKEGRMALCDGINPFEEEFALGQTLSQCQVRCRAWLFWPARTTNSEKKR